MNQPILYDLYNQIRNDRQWGSPGLEEYYLLFDLFNRPEYPLDSFDSVAFVLETIWLKSHQQKASFRNMLEERRQAILTLIAAIKQEETVQQVKDEPGVMNAEKKEVQHKQNDIQPSEKNEPKKNIDEKENTDPENKNSLSNNGINTDDALDFDNAGFSIEHSGKGADGSLHFSRNEEQIVRLVESPWVFTNDYFPVKNRQLQQAWRGLKNKLDGPDAADMNIAKTIDQTARQGYFSNFVFEKKFINQLQLFVLLDQSESMVAQEDFGKELCDSAAQSDLHTGTTPWYFYKLPEWNAQKNDYVLKSENWTESIQLRKLFFKLNRKDIVVLIYSDAGALKGEMDLERCKKTTAFIQHLHANAGYVAWINPAPKIRWDKTNAAHIREALPMFEANRSGIENAIAALKGKTTIVQTK